MLILHQTQDTERGLTGRPPFYRSFICQVDGSRQITLTCSNLVRILPDQSQIFYSHVLYNSGRLKTEVYAAATERQIEQNIP